MKNHDTIATRLAQILNKLNSSERLDVDELVEEFGVTKRTIQRDLNERLSYLPLKKENNLYFLEEYYLGKLNFSDIKNFAMLSGVKELFPSLQESFLKDVLDDTVNKAYLVKGHNYEDISSKTKLFEEIKEAIVESKYIEFVYKAKQRRVQPYKLVNNKGIWYLIALQDDILKTFTFTKMTQVNISDETFTKDKEILHSIENDDNVWFSSEPIEVVISVHKDIADYFTRRDIMPNQHIIKNLEDGGLLVSIKVAYEEEALRLIRYWIPNIKIISPEHLQDKLEKGLREYLR